MKSALLRTRDNRIGGTVLLAAAIACGVCGASAAQTAERNSNQPHATRSKVTSTTPATSSGQQAGPGAMRYYGGPKSPMWRGASTD